MNMRSLRGALIRLQPDSLLVRVDSPVRHSGRRGLMSGWPFIFIAISFLSWGMRASYFQEDKRNPIYRSRGFSWSNQEKVVLYVTTELLLNLSFLASNPEIPRDGEKRGREGGKETGELPHAILPASRELKSGGGEVDAMSGTD